MKDFKGYLQVGVSWKLCILVVVPWNVLWFWYFRAGVVRFSQMSSSTIAQAALYEEAWHLALWHRIEILNSWLWFYWYRMESPDLRLKSHWCQAMMLSVGRPRNVCCQPCWTVTVFLFLITAEHSLSSLAFHKFGASVRSFASRLHFSEICSRVVFSGKTFVDYIFPKYVLALYFPEKRSWTTFFWYRMEGCHLVLIISLMSGHEGCWCVWLKPRTISDLLSLHCGHDYRRGWWVFCV